ncbi:MAG: hypothetical protein K0S37_1992 [Microbacterium sp.]|jgi:hypothetical protein|nr:hypothetical protein [Microbacterium sp.]
MLSAADLLAFEARWGNHTGGKEEAIRRELGETPARYYQLLGRIIDTREALEFDPMLVGRLRRIRDERRVERAGRRAA